MSKRVVTLDIPDPSDKFDSIQNALNGGNVILNLPPGIFHVSKTLRVYSNTVIKATDRTVIRRWDNSMLNYTDCVIANADEYDVGNENIEIDGGIWNANNPKTSTSTTTSTTY